MDKDKKDIGIKIVEKIASKKALKEFSRENSTWNLLDELVQEVQAKLTVDREKLKITELLEESKKAIDKQYGDDEELNKLLHGSLPSLRGFYGWQKRKGWKEAVWKNIETDKLYSVDKKANMVDSLYQRGLMRDTAAAKIWLQMAGLYSDKMDGVADKTLETYRELQEAVHKPKK